MSTKRFPEDYTKEDLAKMVLDFQQELVLSETKYSNLLDKHKNTSIELTKLKRQKSQ